MADESTDQKNPPKREIIPQGEPHTYYANFMAVTATGHDLCLRFGQIQEATAEQVVFDHVVNVYMSAAHAKAVRDVLNRKIAEYEEKFPNWKAVTGG